MDEAHKVHVADEAELNTIFYATLQNLNPTYILDVGTRDGRTAIAMKNANPRSHVIGFEANPENYFDWCILDRVRDAGVWIHHLALSDSVGAVTLHIPHYATRSAAINRGVASLRYRNDPSMTYKEMVVPCTTLDHFFQSEVERDPTFGMWIDVEGALFEVISGATKTLKRTCVLKAEVEGRAYWTGQKLDTEIIDLLSQRGFALVATSDKGKSQYDVIFVNIAEFPDAMAAWTDALRTVNGRMVG